MTRLCMRRRAFIAASFGTGLAAAGCTFTTAESQFPSPQANQSKRAEIDAAVDGALERLYRQEPGSRPLVQQAKGILVFPSVFKAAVGIGGEYGEGALRVGGRTVDYYSATAGSLGFQIGGQRKAIYILFMTEPALAQFQSSSGWQVGADASVALIEIGTTGSVTSETVQRPVVGYVLTTGGLMFDVSLNGTKISKLAI
jgi:lipid-binding SYLF domain-containing protein